MRKDAERSSLSPRAQLNDLPYLNERARSFMGLLLGGGFIFVRCAFFETADDKLITILGNVVWIAVVTTVPFSAYQAQNRILAHPKDRAIGTISHSFYN